MAREDLGRTWVIAPDVERLVSTTLARRIAEGVGAGTAPRGARLQVSIGIAVHPDDGTDAESLVAAAEEGVFGARAAGVSVGGAAAPRAARLRGGGPSSGRRVSPGR
jgi:GGDEF domain-containing protein